MNFIFNRCMNLDKEDMCPHCKSASVIPSEENYCSKCSNCGLVFAMI